MGDTHLPNGVTGKGLICGPAPYTVVLGQLPLLQRAAPVTAPIAGGMHLLHHWFAEVHQLK